ncbi:hypothetical protein [Butyrivibrio sp. AC2005]|uniref:hypothetical protein n=1 Tax=Butyrivibrio sp. AC2005 TaxID=1280672 RepID=UPI00047A7499|nr:hypothetical protein [Butyrivibrio sp. AC2005]
MGINVVVQAGDLIISAPLRHLNWMPRLTTSRKLLTKKLRSVFNRTLLFITYKLSVTNLEFTLGLVQQTDNNGNIMPNRFIPMTLRVEDSSVNKSGGGEIIDFIFSKDASKSVYDTLSVRDERKDIPKCIRALLIKDFYEPEGIKQE